MPTTFYCLILTNKHVLYFINLLTSAGAELNCTFRYFYWEINVAPLTDEFNLHIYIIWDTPGICAYVNR